MSSSNESNNIHETFIHFLSEIPADKEFIFQFLELFPFPIEIFAPDGLLAFSNRAFLELNNIKDPSLIVGKYNLLNDPVCNDQMGLRKSIQKAFRGEAVVAYDVTVPIQDLVDRGVIDEKPFEKSFADFYLYPIKHEGTLVFVVFFHAVKKTYHGKPDMARVREYLETHWKEEFVPEELAKHVNMSVTPLYRFFEEHAGMTPGDYHEKIKIEHIKEKLMDKELSIKQAFAECGEDNHGWIVQAFRKETGMTPAQFRKRNRG